MNSVETKRMTQQVRCNLDFNFLGGVSGLGGFTGGYKRPPHTYEISLLSRLGRMSRRVLPRPAWQEVRSSYAMKLFPLSSNPLDLLEEILLPPPPAFAG